MPPFGEHTYKKKKKILRDIQKGKYPFKRDLTKAEYLNLS